MLGRLQRYCLVSVFLHVLVECVIAQGVEQAHFQVRKTQIITEDFSRYAQKVLDENNIKGLSLAVVQANDVEFGSWGVMTEDGDAVDSKVSFVVKASVAQKLTWTRIRHCSVSARAPKRSCPLLSA